MQEILGARPHLLANLPQERLYEGNQWVHYMCGVGGGGGNENPDKKLWLAENRKLLEGVSVSAETDDGPIGISELWNAEHFSPPHSSHKPCLDMPSPTLAQGQLPLWKAFYEHLYRSSNRKPGHRERTKVPGLSPDVSSPTSLAHTALWQANSFLFSPISSPASRQCLLPSGSVLKQCQLWGLRFPEAPHSLQVPFWSLILVTPDPPCDLGSDVTIIL